MVKATNPQRVALDKKQQDAIDLEIANRKKIGAGELPSSKASQELAKAGALNSGDPSAIAQAKGTIFEPQQQIPVGASASVQDIGSQPTPQEITQPTQDLNMGQKVAKAGLTVPVAIGNTITAGIEAVTGKQFGRTNAGELAQTGAGEALGLAIVGTGIAAIGTYAYSTYLASLTSTELINLASSKAIPVSARIPAINTFTKLTSGKILGLGAVGSIPRVLRKDAKNAVVAQNTAIADVLEDVQLRGKSYATAINELNQIEVSIGHMESANKFWGHADVSHWLGGGLDDEADIANVKKGLEQARVDLVGIAQTAMISKIRGGGNQ